VEIKCISSPTDILQLFLSTIDITILKGNNKNMIIRGPFSLKWGDNVISDVEEIDINHEVSSDDYETLQGKVITVDGSYKVAATVTLLATDIAALAAIMPQYFVPNGGVLSTGETVNYANGAIDIAAAACDTALIFNNLDITSCGVPADVMRIVNARTRIEDVDIDNKIRKVMVSFIGESDPTEATMQFFKQGTIAVVS
jgi:hypothetical protein